MPGQTRRGAFPGAAGVAYRGRVKGAHGPLGIRLIDVGLVRMALVPAVMELLGRANWWLPAPFARVLPRTSLSEDEPPAGARALAGAEE
jgi:hypothetical protein